MTEANPGRLGQPSPTPIISNQEGFPAATKEKATAETGPKSLEEQLAEKDKIIEDLTRQLAEAKAKADQAEKDRLTDSLTGCYSCHAWLDLQSHYDQKRGDRATLIMIDLNNLKKVNDQYGHDAGDEYLKKTSSRLKTVFSRKGDKIYRIGGDEFVVVCKFVPEEDREEFNSFISSSLGHNVMEPLGLDFAFGVAHTDLQQDENLSDTYKRVDTAMYENKKAIKAANPSKYSR